MVNTLFGILSKPSAPKELSVALVANGKLGGCLIDIKPGCVLDIECDEFGSTALDDYGLDDAPEGLSIWEGYDYWTPGGHEFPQDGDIEYRGTFRRLTLDELAKLANGEPLWPEPEPDTSEVAHE